MHFDTDQSMTTITLGPDEPLDLDRTLGCGQAFRWEGEGGWWQGVVDDRAIRIQQDGDLLMFYGADEAFVRDYFRLDQDLPAILASIDRDPIIHDAIRCCYGLRLVRQRPWECLVSYICATNTNIPAVKRRVSHMAERYGEAIEGPFGTTYTFPEPEALAGVCHADLWDCKLGYRTDYVRDAAAFAVENPGWAEHIASLPFEEARAELMRFSRRRAEGSGLRAALCIRVLRSVSGGCLDQADRSGGVYAGSSGRELYAGGVRQNTPVCSGALRGVCGICAGVPLLCAGGINDGRIDRILLLFSPAGRGTCICRSISVIFRNEGEFFELYRPYEER